MCTLQIFIIIIIIIGVLWGRNDFKQNRLKGVFKIENTFALVSRRSWIRIPPKLPVRFFPQTLKKRVYSAIHTSV